MLGFEALLMGKEMHALDAPIYAGWGLSKDYRRFPARTRQRSLDELL
ncbi:hypothetical protein GAO09_26785 [Rhizobiales bacterium RZME27]|uniref:Uncharacterized protein n=1 Tax=Endobacterium cereale TaxID=2663029 RepID=A0A6A8AII5_9HYPH|nr:hypothetical protein [Endobacterium cereale]